MKARLPALRQCGFAWGKDAARFPPPRPAQRRQGREQRILRLRFGLNDERVWTRQEVGAELHLGRERIRRIEDQALAKLRHPSRSRKLREFLD